MAKKELTKITTPTFRVSFPHVYEATVFGDQKTPKFSITMLFDQTADLKEMKKAAMAAAVEKFGPKDTWPDNFKWPFRNGDKKKDMDGYAGKIFVKATTTQMPGVVDRFGKPITQESKKFYAGCHAVATVVCSAFSKSGGNGVTFYLNNIKKVRDDEEFSSRKKAEDDFEFDAEEDAPENDPENYEMEEGDDDSGDMW